MGVCLICKKEYDEELLFNQQNRGCCSPECLCDFMIKKTKEDLRK